MVQVKFGKDYYHLQNQVITWLTQTFGVRYPGGWDGIPEGYGYGLTTMFGTTIIYLRSEEEKNRLIVNWPEIKFV